MAVTVLGLGPMGATLAQAFLGAGHRVVVWNRTPGRSAGLEAAGARAAATAAEAIAATDLTVVCLRDHDATRSAVDGAAAALAGRTVVVLSSGTPDEARVTAASLAGHGADPLTGAIMVPTPLVGTEDGVILISGPHDTYARHRATLDALGGKVEHVGEDHGLASTLDIGMLDVYFSGLLGFVHAVALVGADGVSAERFLRFGAAAVDVLAASLADVARDIDAGSYPGTEDTLDMELSALEHIVGTAERHRVDPAAIGVVRDLARRGRRRPRQRQLLATRRGAAAVTRTRATRRVGGYASPAR